ncbi:MAG TPA: hypothetical protein VJ690_06715 [Burkholderiales bacterium]|nr:hypothetical protein [Burkholderiales bacterium]
MTDLFLKNWKATLEAAAQGADAEAARKAIGAATDFGQAMKIYTEWASGNAACRSSRVLDHRHELADGRDPLVVQQESHTEDAPEEGIEQAIEHPERIMANITRFNPFQDFFQDFGKRFWLKADIPGVKKEDFQVEANGSAKRVPVY